MWFWDQEAGGRDKEQDEKLKGYTPDGFSFLSEMTGKAFHGEGALEREGWFGKPLLGSGIKLTKHKCDLNMLAAPLLEENRYLEWHQSEWEEDGSQLAKLKDNGRYPG
jgi:hypothetical protein